MQNPHSIDSKYIKALETLQKSVPWHQQALLGMIKAFLIKHSLQLTDDLINNELQAALINLLNIEKFAEIESIGSKLRMLHHVEMRLSAFDIMDVPSLSKDDKRNPLLKHLLDIIFSSMIIGAKLDYEAAVFNVYFKNASEETITTSPYILEYRDIKHINQLERDHFKKLNWDNVDLPLEPSQRFSRMAHLLSFADIRALDNYLTTSVKNNDNPKDNLFKLAQAAADVGKIDLKNAKPGHHLKRHHSSLFNHSSLKSKKPEENKAKKAKDDFDVQYMYGRNSKKTGK